IFEIIRSVFEQNIEVLNDDAKRREKARKLMTRIVNILSAKMELGSPMICMYLLGNPDHYTNLQFTSFYWKSFVNEANKWVSVVYDYIYRPRELEDMCLFDFIGCCKRESTSRRASGILDYVECDSLNNCDSSPTCNVFGRKWYDVSPGLYPCLKEHPMSNKCVIELLQNKNRKVPNIIGGSLPRNNEADRGQYCLTMLVLFRPWRTGWQLKIEGESWDDSFDNYTFDPRHSEVMKFFNIRHECKDAADDYYSQLRSTGKGNPDVFGNDDGFHTDSDDE
ncbi:hypothetical protein BDN72DRAFT_748303, partial [Pluteus cervinus]